MLAASDGTTDMKIELLEKAFSNSLTSELGSLGSNVMKVQKATRQQ